jgi:tRNA(Ile)-lysidine synthase
VSFSPKELRKFAFVKKEIQSIFSQNISKWQQKKMLLAHSGGVDSSVLAHLLVKLKCNFAVAHCNFQLRGAESEADQYRVQNWCKQNSVPFFSVRFVLPKKEGSIQSKARQLRYDWFNALLEIHHFDLLLTAHHLNDQLETFLMHLGRGTGLSGLLGIPSSATLFRPLLSFSKKAIEAYAKHNNIDWREDSSNLSLAYWRNALRHEVIAPLLNTHPQYLHHFKNTLAHLNSTQYFVEKQLIALKKTIFLSKKDHISINIKSLKALPSLNFCLHQWFSPLGFHFKEVLKLLEAQTGSSIRSATHRLTHNRSTLLLDTLTLEAPLDDIFYWDLKKPLKNPINLTTRAEKTKNKKSAILNPTLLKMPLKLRKYQRGDYFYPQGMSGKKKLSKFFKDEKYSKVEKEKQWLLCSEDDIVWVIGKRVDQRYAAPDNFNLPLIITAL